MPEGGEVTRLLRAWRGGESGAFDSLVPLVYQDLRKVAQFQIAKESAGHTLTPTGLLHESFLKLMQSGSPPDWQDRKHFFIVASRAMRQLLVDHARRKRAGKRTAGEPSEPLPVAVAAAAAERVLDVVDLDRALASLVLQEPRRAHMLELRYFGGLGLAEISEIVDCSLPTVSRELKLSEAWLAREMRGQNAEA